MSNRFFLCLTARSTSPPWNCWNYVDNSADDACDAAHEQTLPINAVRSFFAGHFDSDVDLLSASVTVAHG